MPDDTKDPMNGFYAAYFTGEIGSSIGMFVFKDGVIAGADAGGGKYDGSYNVVDEGRFVECTVKFILPIGNQSITGATATTEPISIDVPIKLPTDFNRTDVHRIETGLGAINAKFEKIKGI